MTGGSDSLAAGGGALSGALNELSCRVDARVKPQRGWRQDSRALAGGRRGLMIGRASRFSPKEFSNAKQINGSPLSRGRVDAAGEWMAVGRGAGSQRPVWAGHSS